MQQISILGCGWLGFPLALSLQRKGFSLKGSTTSKEKLAVLREHAIEPYLIQLTENTIGGKIDAFLAGSQTLVINVPPGMRGQNAPPFSKKIKALIPFIETSEVEQVLFVSSTSVFSDFQGEVDEDTPPQPDSASGKELFKAEQLLMKNDSFKTTVVRFGGLLGEDRHPVHFLAGREGLSGGDAPVNLIHRADCIGIIEAILEKKYWEKMVHGVAPEHPLKKEYYTKIALEKNLIPPFFKPETETLYKRVTSRYVSNELGYRFKK
ncbi:MAG: SDR family NAD(P)-dependent oxidoreductase [Flavobacteriaceae bacterium]